MVREQRLTDQGMSMHAALRDRATRIATTISIILLCGSIVSAALAFAGDETRLVLLGVKLTRSTWLGVFSVLVFAGTLVELTTDHRGIARQHGGAVRLLSELKSNYQHAAPDATGNWAATATALTTRDDDVMGRISPLPETRFNELKARHLGKVEISKLLSATPGLTERQARRRLRRRLKATPSTPPPAAAPKDGDRDS